MIKNENDCPFEKIKELLFIEYLKKIGSLIKDKQISCFFSYAWGNDEHKIRISNLLKCLSHAGITVWFDLKDNTRTNSSIDNFIKKIVSVQYVVLFYSINLIKKLKEEDSIIKREIEYINNSDDFDADKLICFNLDEKDVLYDEIPILSRDKIIKYYKPNDLDVLIDVVFDLLLNFCLEEQEQNIIKIIYAEFQLICKKITTKYSPERIEQYVSVCLKSANPIINIDFCQLLKSKYQNKFNSNSGNQVKKNLIKLPINIQWSCYANAAKINSGECIDALVGSLIKNCLEHKHIPVVLAGDPAMGKTTLCRYITNLWMWSNRILADFKLVFFIEVNNLCKSVDSVDFLAMLNSYTEIDLIIKELFSYELSDFIIPILLDINLNYYRHNILWIIDGDEEVSSNIIPEHVKAVIAKIKTYPYVITTTIKYSDKLCYHQLIGFNDFLKTRYIEIFFSLQGQKLSNNITKLLDFFDYNQILGDLASIPGVLNIICDTWLSYAIKTDRALATNIPFNISIATLYKKIFQFIFYRKFSQNSSCEYATMTSASLMELAVKKIAWISYCKGAKQCQISDLQQIINELLVKYNFKKSEAPIIFRKILTTGIVLQKKKYLEFIDYSMHIFLVVGFLLENLKDSQDERLAQQLFVKVINSCKYTKNNQFLLIIMSGILARDYVNFTPELIKKINKLFWKTICLSSDVIGINYIRLLLNCLAETEYTKIFEYYENMKFFILDFFKYIFQNKASYTSDGVKEIFLELSANVNAMDMLVNIIDDQEFLCDLLEFIEYHDKNFHNSMLKCFFSLSLNSHQKFKNLLQNIAGSLILAEDIHLQIKNLLKYNDLIMALQSGELSLKKFALKCIYSEKISNSHIVDSIFAIMASPDEIDLIDSVQIYYKISNRTFFIRNLYDLCSVILYNIKLQYEIFDIMDTASHKKEIFIKRISFLIQHVFENEDQNKRQEISRTLNENVRVAKEEYDYDYDYIHDFNNALFVVTKRQQYWSINLNSTQLNSLSDYEIDRIFESFNYFLKIELIVLVQAFAKSYREVLSKWIIKRLIHNCHKEMLLIVNSGIIIYNQENTYYLPEGYELWKNDTNLKRALLKALSHYWRANHLMFPFRQLKFTSDFYCGPNPSATASILPVTANCELEDVGIPKSDSESFDLKLEETTIASKHDQGALTAVRSDQSTILNSILGLPGSDYSVLSQSRTQTNYLRYCESKDRSLFSYSSAGSESGNSILSPPRSQVSSLKHCESNNTSSFDSTPCGSVSGGSKLSTPIAVVSYFKHCESNDPSCFNSSPHRSISCGSTSRSPVSFSSPRQPKERLWIHDLNETEKSRDFVCENIDFILEDRAKSPSEPSSPNSLKTKLFF